MENIGALFVHRPVSILLVAGLFVVASRVLASTDLGQGRRPGALMVPAIAWALYAAWEWLVMAKTPEANIRVDLLIVCPVLLIVSAWFITKALRRAS